PIIQPALLKILPKAMAEAMPEQNTKISVASEKPKRAGIQRVQGLPLIWAIRMIYIPTPRKKSRRGSRAGFAEVLEADIAALIWLPRSRTNGFGFRAQPP